MASPYTPTSPGQINSSGDSRALYLKVFTGEVLQTYQTACVTLPLIRTRTISSGKTAQFIVTGRVSGHFHSPGTELNGQAFRDGEKTINIDDLFVVDTFHADIDEALAQWDTRAPIAAEHGNALARKMDDYNLITIANAARTAATLTGGYGGTVNQAGATVVSSAAVLTKAIESAAQTLDEKDVSKDGRKLILRPAQHWLLMNDQKVANSINRGSANISTGDLPTYAGFEFIKSNRLPSTNIASATTGENNVYTGDFTNTVALAFTPDAIGRVTLIGIKTETERSVRHQGTLLVSKFASGAGVLRPECAVEIRQDSAS